MVQISLSQPASRQAASPGPSVLCGRPAAVGSSRLAAGGRRRQRAAVGAAAVASADKLQQHDAAPTGSQHTLLRTSHPLATAPGAAAMAAAAALPLALLLAAPLAFPSSADAFELYGEPANALSLPTWAVHTSSVMEWVVAMGLM